MIDVAKLRSKLKVIFMQVKNFAIADGRVSSDEIQIIKSFQTIVDDISIIITSTQESLVLDSNATDVQNKKIVLNAVFQLILVKLIETVSMNGVVTPDEFELVEKIGNTLDEITETY